MGNNVKPSPGDMVGQGDQIKGQYDINKQGGIGGPPQMPPGSDLMLKFGTGPEMYMHGNGGNMGQQQQQFVGLMPLN